MATYLLTWNPKHYAWENLKEEPYDPLSRWSVGKTKKIRIGDRFFFMRLGKEPKGIIGSGFFKSEPYDDAHWDPRKSGEMALYADTDFDDVLLNSDEEKILSLNILKGIAEINWTPYASGMQIREDVAKELEKGWANFLMERGELPIIDDESEIDDNNQTDFNIIKTMEGEEYVREAKFRYRNKKLIKERKSKSDYRCEVCGIKFSDIYGEIGKNYILAHHINPIGERTRASETKLEDIALLCDNCHRMIHRTKPPMSINKLRNIFIKKKGGINTRLNSSAVSKTQFAPLRQQKAPR